MNLKSCLMALAVTVASITGAIAGTAPTSQYLEPLVMIHIKDVSECSGSFIGPKLVLTAKHCTEGQKPTDLIIEDSKGSAYEAATIDEDPNSDVSLIGLRVENGVNDAAISCQMPDRLDRLVAAGHPLDMRDQLSVLDVTGYQPKHPFGALRVAGMLMPGMSGGPVFDMENRVIGVVSAGVLFDLGGPFGGSVFSSMGIIATNHESRICNANV